MEGLCYSALDIAVIISGMDLGCRETANILEQIWENERPFLQKDYRNNKRRLLSETNYWLTYLTNKAVIDAEFPMIQRDVEATGGELEADAYITDVSGLNLFFKNARLRILYGGGNPYVRVKRRTLMETYGYKRLSPALVEYFHQCVFFYHLQPYVRDYVECQIEDVGIDDMVVFRIV